MEDELTVRMGEVVKNVTKASEDGWLAGELRGTRGIFPANFTKVCYCNTAQLKVLHCLYCMSSCSSTLLKYATLWFLFTGGADLFDRWQPEGTTHHENKYMKDFILKTIFIISLVNNVVKS